MTDIEHSNLLSRGVAEIIVEQEFIQLLKSGRSLRLKEGFDPSAPDIHLGHAAVSYTHLTLPTSDLV